MVAPSTSTAFDRPLALSRVGGDAELLKEIATIFLEDYPRTLAELHEAVAHGDSIAIERSAHGLKGSVANFGAPAAVDAAFRLEQLGRTQRLAEVAHVLNSLELALAALRPELESL